MRVGVSTPLSGGRGGLVWTFMDGLLRAVEHAGKALHLTRVRFAPLRLNDRGNQS
jgi:hypothetical protein